MQEYKEYVKEAISENVAYLPYDQWSTNKQKMDNQTAYNKAYQTAAGTAAGKATGTGTGTGTTTGAGRGALNVATIAGISDPTVSLSDVVTQGGE